MSGGKHCYPGTDILINKYDIHDKTLLERLEIQKVAIKLLGLDVYPNKVVPTFDIDHLTAIHKYLFDDIYEWSGEFRKENLYKSERVLSGGSAEYADYHDIKHKLIDLFDKYGKIKWNQTQDLTDIVSDFLLELWTIHPFREGNTRTCVAFLCHYLREKGINFRVDLLRNNPMYVRDSLVMANYDQKTYLKNIISDALSDFSMENIYKTIENEKREQYQISKTDYEIFRNKYLTSKGKN